MRSLWWSGSPDPEMNDFIALLERIPDGWVYLGLSVGAALENVIPAVPADSFVALGGFLAGTGGLRAEWVALGTWFANVASALYVVHLSRAHGPAFFDSGLGRHLLRKHQMDRLERFYERWGLTAIFVSRFLPGFRAIVPVFAGATQQSIGKLALPLASASGIWYGGLVYLGVLAGQNLDRLEGWLGQISATFAVVAVTLTVVVAVWWIRSRKAP